MENYFFLFAVSVLLLPTITKTHPITTHDHHLQSADRNALLAFKHAITLDRNNTLSGNWSISVEHSVCRWIGVSCGHKHGRIISLDVSGFGLGGPLPPHIGNLTFLKHINVSSNNFAGILPPELSRLPRLRWIDASHNSFAGKIPPSFGASPRLEALILTNNSFSGSIPEEIGNSSSLRFVEFSYNRLTGSVKSGLFNISSVEEIWISSNEISGRLPSDMCERVPKLETLALSDNRIEGRIPSRIRECRALERLSLSYNRFEGEIPREIGGLSELTVLYLGDNDFRGGIPAELGRLSRLEILRIDNASLTGSIPKEIGNCTSLQEIGLTSNHLTGSIPEQLWNITSLINLYLYNNYLTGSLPSKSSLFHLETLLLNDNELSGEIPSSITNSSELTLLQLSGNSFSGPVPDFGSLQLLQRLYIWDNNLSSPPNRDLEFISSLTKCRFLEELQIAGNPLLNGILPASIGNLSKTLRNFNAEGCNINGVIPSTIGNLTGLEILFLEGNRLTEFIPPTIGKLEQIRALYLGGNRLHGYIPPALCRLNHIFYLSFKDNILTGPIPECLGEMSSLRNIFLESNKLSSTIPSDFWNLTDLVSLNLSSNFISGRLSPRISSLKAISKLDLSHNRFSGNIPSSIDGCQSLEFLSLSNNGFSGSIPPSIGNMRGLITLDLSSNNISGAIPESLESLENLRSVNVSHNSALCGAAKFRVPPCSVEENRTSRLKKVQRLMKYILPPFVLVICLAAIIIYVRRRRESKRVQAPAHISPGVAAWRRVSYFELVRGTNEFSETNLLGRGSFGSVFKATLSDGLTVAAKVFDSKLERATRSFEVECEVLGKVRHRNLVRVIGCCSNTEFKALILEHMPNGSLEKWLHSDNCCLNLRQSLGIAIDVASALEYLHHGYTFPVVHCDVKPSNVLLDEDMVACLADFGVSKLFEDGETMARTKTLATIGYAAPEYGSEGKVSTSGDVYSYGILLLEIFTRKKPTDEMFSEGMSLKEWVHRALQRNDVSEVAALSLVSRDDRFLHRKEYECLFSTFSLAMKCLAVSPAQRTNMTETVATLQRIKDELLPRAVKRRQ